MKSKLDNAWFNLNLTPVSSHGACCTEHGANGAPTPAPSHIGSQASHPHSPDSSCSATGAAQDTNQSKHIQLTTPFHQKVLQVKICINWQTEHAMIHPVSVMIVYMKKWHVIIHHDVLTFNVRDD